VTFVPTILTTASGRSIDLIAPRPADIDFADVAQHLAKCNRYVGATAHRAYSVAEHLVRAADLALAETKDATLAAYVLCHDMHEAYLGDDVTPKKRALAAIAIENYGQAGELVYKLHELLAYRLDVAIHAAAGLFFPLPSLTQKTVKHYDETLLATEWRELMCVPPPFPAVAAAAIEIECWGWATAADALLMRCRVLLPSLRGENERIARTRAREKTFNIGPGPLPHNKSPAEQGGCP
jgi:hypothetical protein